MLDCSVGELLYLVMTKSIWVLIFAFGIKHPNLWLLPLFQCFVSQFFPIYRKLKAKKISELVVPDLRMAVLCQLALTNHPYYCAEIREITFRAMDSPIN